MTSARLRRILVSNIFALLIQFLLGMAANLFVSLPAHHAGANDSDFFGGAFQSLIWVIGHGPLVIILHAILGVIVILGSFAILRNGIQLKRRAYIIWSVVAVVGILGAGINGASFLTYNHDVNSYLMAVGFAVGVTAYSALLFLAVSEPA